MSFLIRIRRALKFPVPQDQRLLPQEGHVTEVRHTLMVQVQHTSKGMPKTHRKNTAGAVLCGSTRVVARIIDSENNATISAPSVINALRPAATLNCSSKCDALTFLGDGPSSSLSRNGELVPMSFPCPLFRHRYRSRLEAACRTLVSRPFAVPILGARQLATYRSWVGPSDAYPNAIHACRFPLSRIISGPGVRANYTSQPAHEGIHHGFGGSGSTVSQG
jgi:hypothetical protein